MGTKVATRDVRVRAHGTSAGTDMRIVQVQKSLMTHNDGVPAENRVRFARRLVLNIVSSPGSGKTALMERTVRELAADLAIGVVVGNLVCPAAWDLGEDLRVTMLSVTEGEDKPLKYPRIFKDADAVIINKIDIAEAVGFDRDRALESVRQVTPNAKVFELSARTGEGMAPWLEWLRERRAAKLG